MIRQDIDVNGYWKIIVVYNVELGQKDGGFTYTDFKKKQSIVGIGKSTSDAQFLNTITHEAKHIQSHICKFYSVEEDSEEAAYLIGYIVQQMFSVFKKFIRKN
jgi:hypothetical protein